jgi:hypothetical protein
VISPQPLAVSGTAPTSYHRHDEGGEGVGQRVGIIGSRRGNGQPSL